MTQRKKSQAPQSKRAAPTRAVAVRRRRVVKAGRPAAADVARMKREILDIAADVFLTLGYADASVTAVATAARASRTTLYSRYANKEALFRAVVEDRRQQWSAESSKANWMVGKTFEQRLRHYTSKAIERALSKDVVAFDDLY